MSVSRVLRALIRGAAGASFAACSLIADFDASKSGSGIAPVTTARFGRSATGRKNADAELVRQCRPMPS